MTAQRTIVTLIGIAIVVAASLFGYWLSVRVERGATDGATETGLVRPSPVPVTPAPTEGAATPTPTPRPATGEVRPAGRPAVRGVTHPLLTIEAVPSVIRPGTALTVRWVVRGPEGIQGLSTKLTATLTGAPDTTSPVVASFALPARFEVTVRPATAGDLRLMAEAVVNGSTLRAEQRLKVE